jgi:hypothetical protein
MSVVAILQHDQTEPGPRVSKWVYVAEECRSEELPYRQRKVMQNTTTRLYSKKELIRKRISIVEKDL